MKMKLFQKITGNEKENGGNGQSRLSQIQSGSGLEAMEMVTNDVRDLPSRVLDLSDEVRNDFQRVIESLRSRAIENDLRVIGIASAVPGQGNSTVAAILSLLLAGRVNGHFKTGFPNEILLGESDQNVVLIDSQIRHPSLHGMFDVRIEKGLSELIYDGISLSEGMKEIEGSRLRLITAGRENGYQYTRTHLKEIGSLLKEIKESNVEYILLDIPPLLHYAEGVALSSLCDGIVLVVRAGSSRLAVVREAKRLMKKAKVPMIGAVLNRREYNIPGWIYRML